MNPPPNGIWRKTGGNEYGLFWDGSKYLATTDINTIAHHNAMLENPEYKRIFDSDQEFVIDQYESEELTGVEVIANKIKKIFSSETYNTPKKRTNAVYIAVAVSAVVVALLVYFKKIKF